MGETARDVINRSLMIDEMQMEAAEFDEWYVEPEKQTLRRFF